MSRILLLDFCDTCVDFQTFDPYVEFVLQNKKPYIYRILCRGVVKKMLLFFSRILKKIGITKYIYKEALVHQLRGISEKELMILGKEYYVCKIEGHRILETIELIKKYQDDNYEVIILSGGSFYYISEYANQININHCITTRLEIKEGYATGRLLWDCLGNMKPKLLKEYLTKNSIKVDECAGITDSKSDMPMLEMCSKKIIMSKHHQNWVTEDMEEVIWEQVV